MNCPYIINPIYSPALRIREDILRQSIIVPVISQYTVKVIPLPNGGARHTT